MTKRLLPVLLLATVACAGGEGDEAPATFSDSFTNAGSTMPTTTTEDDSDSESTDTDETDDTDESTTDPSTTDPSTTDPSTTGDGDGDTDSGDGDGDEVDPCVEICEGKVTATPNTCDNPFIIGRTDAKEGFYRGASTLSATNDDTENCGPHDNPENLDTGGDHFYRIWLELGDTVLVQQNPSNWFARLKIHDEADCVGNAKECTVEPDPAIIEYEAPKSDWFTIVVDGRSLGLGDQGDYALNVDLTPGPTPDMCSCP